MDNAIKCCCSEPNQEVCQKRADRGLVRFCDAKISASAPPADQKHSFWAASSTTRGRDIKAIMKADGRTIDVRTGDRR